MSGLAWPAGCYDCTGNEGTAALRPVHLYWSASGLTAIWSAELEIAATTHNASLIEIERDEYTTGRVR